jgi:hypothetical protein
VFWLDLFVDIEVLLLSDLDEDFLTRPFIGAFDPIVIGAGDGLPG